MMIHWIGLRENLLEKAKVFTIKYRAVLLEFPRQTRYGCRAFPASRASVVKEKIHREIMGDQHGNGIMDFFEIMESEKHVF